MYQTWRPGAGNWRVRLQLLGLVEAFGFNRGGFQFDGIRIDQLGCQSAFGRVSKDRRLPTCRPFPAFVPGKVLVWTVVTKFQITKQWQTITRDTRAGVGHVLCDDQHRAMPTERHRGLEYDSLGPSKQQRVLVCAREGRAC